MYHERKNKGNKPTTLSFRLGCTGNKIVASDNSTRSANSGTAGRSSKGYEALDYRVMLTAHEARPKQAFPLVTDSYHICRSLIRILSDVNSLWEAPQVLSPSCLAFPALRVVVQITTSNECKRHKPKYNFSKPLPLVISRINESYLRLCFASKSTCKRLYHRTMLSSAVEQFQQYCCRALRQKRSIIFQKTVVLSNYLYL